jgi:hypothetical protein
MQEGQRHRMEKTEKGKRPAARPIRTEQRERRLARALLRGRRPAKKDAPERRDQA